MDAVTQQFSRFPLDTGSHRGSDGALCVMECVAYVAGVPHTDHPKCACPVITELATHVNDTGAADVRAALASRILRLAGSRGDDEVTARRASFLLDFVLRTLLPQGLSRFGDGGQAALAQAFSALNPVSTPADLKAAVELFAQIPEEMTFGTRHLTDGAEISERLERALVALADKKYAVAAFTVTDLFIDIGVDVDYLSLLDSLLDIGGTPALDISPDVASRISALANRVNRTPTGHNWPIQQNPQ